MPDLRLPQVIDHMFLVRHLEEPGWCQWLDGNSLDRHLLMFTKGELAEEYIECELRGQGRVEKLPKSRLESVIRACYDQRVHFILVDFLPERYDSGQPLQYAKLDIRSIMIKNGWKLSMSHDKLARLEADKMIDKQIADDEGAEVVSLKDYKDKTKPNGSKSKG